MVKQSALKTTLEKAEQFEMLTPLLEAMYDEFKELSKKKPDGQVGKVKARMVNRPLEPIHRVLESEPNFMFLDRLDEDELPQNSDVVLILSQSRAALNAFRDKYKRWDGIDAIWST